MSSTEGSASATVYETSQILASYYLHYKRFLINQTTVSQIFFYSSCLNHGEVPAVLNISIYNITTVLLFTRAKTSHSNFILTNPALDMKRLLHKYSVIKILFFLMLSTTAKRLWSLSSNAFLSSLAELGRGLQWVLKLITPRP